MMMIARTVSHFDISLYPNNRPTIYSQHQKDMNSRFNSLEDLDELLIVSNGN